MKRVSSLALGAALVVGGWSGVALAKEKAAPAAAAVKLGAPFRALAGPAQAAIKANDFAGADAKVTALEAASTTPDEKYVAGQLRLQVATGLKDQAMQGRAVKAMLESGSPSANADLPRLNYYAGTFAYQANDFAAAARYLTEAARLGYTDNNNVYLMLAEANFKQNAIPAGLAQVDKAVELQTAAGQKPPEAWYARAASVAYKAKLMGDAAKWTRAQVRAYPTKENWRSALVIYRDSAMRDGQLNLDIFRLMRVSKSLAGERDYYELASTAFERGLPGEAKSVLDEGAALGALPSGSRPIADLRAAVIPKVASDQASLPAAEKQAASSATGRVASATGDAFLGYGQDAKAAALYRTALTKGGVDADQVNTRLGIALTRLGQKADARTALQAVKGPRAEIAAFWLLWLDQQPG